jgi:mono/diheme cytochrome c family protein
MQVNRTRAVAAVFAIATIVCGTSLAIGVAQAQAPAPQAAAAASNDLQRSVEVYGYNAAAKSGAARGEVIYYYKCWNCHNDYTRAAGSPAPTLKGVFSRPMLVTGDPVNDETVAKQIRNGSPQMPSFGTALKDADIADLLAYLHNGCCYEETRPPVNPWYRANAQNSPPMPERGNLRGGPSGMVRSAGGDRLEGIMVHHGHHQPGRTIRIPATAAGLVHLAHRQAGPVPALPARRRAGRQRREVRRHRAATAIRDGFPASHHRRSRATDGR